MDKIDKLSNLHVKVEGVNLENLLFDLSCAGISLKHVKKHKKVLKFVVSGQNYDKLLFCIKKYDQKITVIKQSGFASLLKRLPYSVGAFLGMIASCFFVIDATQSIASVDIEIFDRQNQIIVDQTKNSEILNYLKEIGVERGAKFEGKIKNKENQLVANFDYVESCRIERYGNYVKVQIKEANVHENMLSTIVSEYSGIVTNIVTFAGKARVKAGDIVTEGQVLVSKDGEILPKAQIDIKLWSVATKFVYEKTQKVVRTGKKQISKALFAFDKQIFGHSKCKFATYEIEKTTAKINFVFPIEIETLVFFETKIVEEIVKFEDVEEQIKEQAKSEAIKKAGDNYGQITYAVSRSNGMVRVDCFVETHRQILIK